MVNEIAIILVGGKDDDGGGFKCDGNQISIIVLNPHEAVGLFFLSQFS